MIKVFRVQGHLFRLQSQIKFDFGSRKEIGNFVDLSIQFLINCFRFVFTEGVLYNQFLSQADYDTVKNYADQLGVVVWCKDDKRTLVVTKDGHDDVKRYG